jgi:hypothetical protein
MGNLGSHGNVWETCLQLLERKGYDLSVVTTERDDAPDDWRAEKDGFRFFADNPIELIGLVAIYEELRPTDSRAYWWTAQTRRDVELQAALYTEAAERMRRRADALRALREADAAAWQEEIRERSEETSDDALLADALGITLGELDRVLGDPLLQDLGRPRR